MSGVGSNLHTKKKLELCNYKNIVVEVGSHGSHFVRCDTVTVSPNLIIIVSILCE